MIGELSAVAFDCLEPETLARFYRELCGGEVVVDPTEDDWVDLVLPSGLRLGFQLCPGYLPPVWPGDDGDQQAHLDVKVANLAAADPLVRAAGATFMQANEGFWVYLDPAGHPFCTVL